MMRDPKRIKVIITMVNDLWQRYPDMRLAQLLQSFGGFTRLDNYYLEDGIVEQVLYGYWKRINTQQPPEEK